MCDCATELERKRREVEQRSSLKSRSASGVSSCCSLVPPGAGDDGRPGLIRAFMMFLRGEISLSEVAQASGFSGMLGGLAGGAALLATLAMLYGLHGGNNSWNFSFNKWRKPPETNCIPKPAAGEGPTKINKKRLKWPPKDDEN